MIWFGAVFFKEEKISHLKVCFSGITSVLWAIRFLHSGWDLCLWVPTQQQGSSEPFLPLLQLMFAPDASFGQKKKFFHFDFMSTRYFIKSKCAKTPKATKTQLDVYSLRRTQIWLHMQDNVL